MDLRKITELAMAVMKSPRGLMAVIAILGSLVAFVYLFLLKPSSSSKGSRSGRSVSNKRSTSSSGPKKTSTASSVKKSLPNKESNTKKVKEDSKVIKTTNQDASKTSKSSKSGSNNSEKKQAKSTDASKQAGKPANKAVSKKPATRDNQQSQKDDGEWITVAKKKPRRTA